uniref:Uncharacterized protein n=1 Tax=Coccolithus braarudii TaxID=221442 RepID=A0A7S0QBL1_9EUKA|mmetsp:Transcript_8292/g.18193  ORF Transcript_8292/g.18193 Transcript_8292/m.18193 type:complete len:292 (+) Transcript_8292:65-940(+)
MSMFPGVDAVTVEGVVKASPKVPAVKADGVELGISGATFDYDDSGIESAGSSEVSSICFNCTPQAARWTCKSDQVEAFDVTWYRVSKDETNGVAVHTERVDVHATKEAADDCFSSYMPSMDDVNSILQVSYTPIPINKGASGAAWGTHVYRTKYAVQANEQTTFQVGDAVRRGIAEFNVVCEGDQWSTTDTHVQLAISKSGVKATRIGGLQALAGCISGEGTRFLPFCEGIEVNSVASVVLPSELLQVKLAGDDGDTITVQAESASLRDAIVMAARRFAAIASRSTPKKRG